MMPLFPILESIRPFQTPSVLTCLLYSLLIPHISFIYSLPVFQRTSPDDGVGGFDIASIESGMSAPLPVRWMPKYSLTNVPVVLSRLVWRHPGAPTCRVFQSARDAALYLCIIYQCESVRSLDVARCAEGQKIGSVRGTFHNARYATQITCNQYGPVCRLKKIEVVDESKRMSEFIKTRAPSPAQGDFFTYRERPDSVSSMASTPSPRPPAFSAPRPSQAPAPRCPTPQNLIRPICAVPPSPWGVPDVSGSSSPPVIQEHVDGERYALIPIPDYQAPPETARVPFHMRRETEDNFTRLSARTTAGSIGTNHMLSFSDDGNETSAGDGTSYTTNWQNDRERSSSTLNGGNETSDILYRFKERLKSSAESIISFFQYYPSDDEILKMAATLPCYNIITTDPGRDLFDNYIAAFLAVVSVNTRWNCADIIGPIVRATEGVEIRNRRLTEDRVKYISNAFTRFRQQNRPSHDINTVDSDCLNREDSEIERIGCWKWLRQIGVYEKICRREGVRPTVQDVRVVDPQSSSGAKVSLRGVLFEEFDRVEAESNSGRGGHKTETKKKIVCMSVLTRLGLKDLIETGKALEGTPTRLVWKPR